MVLQAFKKLKWWFERVPTDTRSSPLDLGQEAPHTEHGSRSHLPPYRPLGGGDERVNALFARLRGELIRRTSLGGPEGSVGMAPPWRLVHGRLKAGSTLRPYCYVQKWNDQGWLFEQIDGGWIITPSDQDTGHDTFIRSQFNWDVATVWAPETDPEALLRIRSERYGDDFLSYRVYEQRILADLDISEGLDTN